MKNSTKILIAVFLWVGSFGYAQHEHEHGAAAGSEAITGEVMDLACYTSHPDTGKGLSHAKCARQCLQKGIPAGILTQDGTLYIALGTEHGTANQILEPYAGQVVNIEGQVKEMNGVKFITVEKVKE